MKNIEDNPFVECINGDHKIYGLVLQYSDDEILFTTLDLIEPILAPREKCRLISEKEYFTLRKNALNEAIKNLENFNAGELAFKFKQHDRSDVDSDT